MNRDHLNIVQLIHTYQKFDNIINFIDYYFLLLKLNQFF